MTAHRATAFLAAFNDIEQHLRSNLNAKNSDSFWWIVDRAREKHIIFGKQAEALKDFANLRNAISHGRYYESEPIAEPHAQVVEQISTLRDIVVSPPETLRVLRPQKVFTLTSSTSIMDAFSIIKDKDFSQIPIYDEGKFIALLTTNTIARWVAADFSDNQELNAADIADIVKYQEPGDRAIFLTRTVTVQQTMDRLSETDNQGHRPCAAVITEHGKVDERPLRLVAPADLPVLMDALEWE
ncbi:CBS domain-containing protein [Corynebacterium aurimucosum]|uniref:CBS domain-containing protein n=1 Tax=Corynebacterium aurimucosum TaxID=169292 RepID=UPI00066B2521|nr:CBS domain-containing protein [Corynebacterium aurimucosum]